MVIIGITNTLGRLAGGKSGDKFGIVPTFGVAMCVAGVLMILLPFDASYTMMVIFAVGFGFCGGTFGAMFPVVQAELFGLAQLPRALGVGMTSWAWGGIIGTPLAGWIYDTTGSYTAAWIFCGVLWIAGGCCVWFSGTVLERWYPNRCKRPPAEERAMMEKARAAKRHGGAGAGASGGAGGGSAAAPTPAGPAGTQARELLGRNTIAAPSPAPESSAPPGAPAPEKATATTAVATAAGALGVVRASRTVTLRQMQGQRFLDAYTTEAKGHAAVTVATGYVAESFKWVLTPVPGAAAGAEEEFTLQQRTTGRYLDAYTTEAKEFGAVTVAAAGDIAESFKWVLTPVGEGKGEEASMLYTLRQKVTGRYLDAYTNEAKEFRAVTVAAGYIAESFKWVFEVVPVPEAKDGATSTAEELARLLKAEALLDTAQTRLQKAEAELKAKDEEKQRLMDRVMQIEKRLGTSEEETLAVQGKLLELEQSKAALQAKATLALTGTTRSSTDEVRCCMVFPGA